MRGMDGTRANNLGDGRNFLLCLELRAVAETALLASLSSSRLQPSSGIRVSIGSCPSSIAGLVSGPGRTSGRRS